jgi:glycosyltransferase involved in cell wall biosynthesis
MDATKGAHILIRALRSIQDAPLSFDIFGVAQGEVGLLYLERLKGLAADDRRIHFHAPIPCQEVVAALQDYDGLAVPSQCLETGPMVVLEAFAAGLPVIGSNLGGIAELVRDGIDGLLVNPQSIESWAGALRRFCGNAQLRSRLRSAVQPPRTMSVVADETLDVYVNVLRQYVRSGSLCARV